MGAVLRVLHLNVLLYLVVVEILFSLGSVHSAFSIRDLTHSSRTTCTQTLNGLRTEAAQNILNLIGVPLDCKLSPRLEYNWNYMLHATTHEEKCTHRIDKIIILFELSH